MQLLPQLDVDAAKAGAAGRGRRAFQRGVGILNCSESFGGERAAKRIEGGLAGEMCLPDDVYSKSIEDALRSGSYFWADAVAGNKRDLIRHGYPPKTPPSMTWYPVSDYPRRPRRNLLRISHRFMKLYCLAYIHYMNSIRLSELPVASVLPSAVAASREGAV